MSAVAETYFIHLLKSAVNPSFERPACPLHSEDEWKHLHRLARRNKLDSLLYEELKDEPSVPPWLLSEWEGRCCEELMLDVRQRYEVERIAATFAAAGVPFAFVKGGLLKAAYPFTHVRYMSDIDLVILPRDRERVHACMESIGAAVSGYDGNDQNFEMPDGVHVETHGYMFFRKVRGGTVPYADVRYFDTENNRLTAEGFALNLLTHMISNLCQMGLGIRYVLDLWVYRHRYPEQPDWGAVFDELRRAGLEAVARSLVTLSEHWFGDEETDDLPDGLEEYILASSLYGMSGQVALNNASMAGCKTGAIMHRLFLPKEEYCKRYPWLERRPWLLPAAWCVRVVQMFRRHGHNVVSWTGGLITTRQEDVHRRREMLKRIGF